MPRTITCQDCSHPQQVTAKNALRCYVCRLVTNLTFTRGRQSKCWVCESVYCPIARDDQLCGNCAFKPKNSQIVRCVFCHEDKHSVAEDIAVCMWCARDVKNRKQFLAACIKKQKQRQENPPSIMDTVPAPEETPVV